MLAIQSFGQGDYAYYVDYLKKRWTNNDIQLPIKYLDQGIKSMTFYSCNDTLFSQENCSKIQAIYFNVKSNTILDTVFTGKYSTLRKTEVSQKFIKVTEASIAHDTTQSLFSRFVSQPVMGLKVDSLVLNAVKNPIELYENKKLKTKWVYDPAGRIIAKIDNINNDNTRKTTTISYQPNTLTESTETKFYAEISNHKNERHFDAKSKLLLREAIYNEKTNFLYKDRKIHLDSIILHEPLELSRYTVYSYKPSNTQVATFYDRDHDEEKILMIIIRKHDKKNRIAYQHVLGEKKDTLSFDVYEYSKRKIIKNYYQDNKLFDRTIKYFNNKGQLIKTHEETTDPFIWETTYYNTEGIMTKNVDVNYEYKKMRIIIIEK